MSTGVEKEWTIMFYFAGDNALSPLIVSQLKALKDAGFHEDVDVLAYFDSNEAGVPTRVFDVNRRRKEGRDSRGGTGRRSMVGDGRDSFVRDLTDDDVSPDEIKGDGDSLSGKLRAALEQGDGGTAAESLRNFLGFCRENHRAKNYILVLLGHGLVVGNDTFLPDENPVSAITLEELQTILKGFTDAVKGDKSDENPEGGALQLLALHSCAMSAIEVAYQLKGTARFMLGSEGVAYVDSWPYRQMMKRILNFVDRVRGGEARREDDRVLESDRRPTDAHANDPRDLIERLYFHVLFNATDFMLSGYSLELSLCNLDPDNFGTLTEAIRALVVRLRRALESKDGWESKDGRKNELGQELILLAHWDSQSYWEESYTDLFDFCFCLRRRCRSALGLLGEYGDASKTGEVRAELEGLMAACTGVITELDRERSDKLDERFSKVVVHSCHFGPEYQYSHGLSVYFPWSRPLDDDPPANIPEQLQLRQSGPGIDSRGILARYARYAFNVELGEKESWLAFLNSYFDMTKRDTRLNEERGEGMDTDEAEGAETDEHGRLRTPFPVFNPFGGQSDNPFPALGRESPRVGESCTCPSIKNYPTDEITTRRGKNRPVRAVTASKIVWRKLRQTQE